MNDMGHPQITTSAAHWRFVPTKRAADDAFTQAFEFAFVHHLTFGARRDPRNARRRRLQRDRSAEPDQASSRRKNPRRRRPPANLEIESIAVRSTRKSVEASFARYAKLSASERLPAIRPAVRRPPAGCLEFRPYRRSVSSHLPDVSRNPKGSMLADHASSSSGASGAPPWPFVRTALATSASASASRHGESPA